MMRSEPRPGYHPSDYQPASANPPAPGPDLAGSCFSCPACGRDDRTQRVTALLAESGAAALAGDRVISELAAAGAGRGGPGALFVVGRGAGALYLVVPARGWPLSASGGRSPGLERLVLGGTAPVSRLVAGGSSGLRAAGGGIGGKGRAAGGIGLLPSLWGRLRPSHQPVPDLASGTLTRGRQSRAFLTDP